MSRAMILAFCAVLGCGGLAPGAESPSPYGVCAHLGGGQEYDDLVREVELMQAAGIRWARADFTWGAIEPADGRFDFAAYDRVVSESLAHGVMPLPILCYDSPWAGLAHQNLPAWTRFVGTVVRRYADRVKHWEVWNEPNIEFWKPKPDPAQYAALLKATHAAIKGVDPGLQVVYGGTAGIPLDFIRKTLELGAGAGFDIMAIHPYSYPDTPERGGRLREIDALKALLTEFKAPTRLWITETGWPTHRDPEIEDHLPLWQSLVTAAAVRVAPERLGWDVAVLCEQGSDVSDHAAAALLAALAGTGRYRCRPVSVSDIAAGISPNDAQVLIGPIGEAFPETAFAGMVEFVRQGGLLVHFAGVPFYYTTNRGADGAWVQSRNAAGESFRQALHIGWQAWWTEKGLPEEASVTRAASPDVSVALPAKGVKSTRWFTDQALKGGDRMVPLLAGYNGETRVGYPSVLYQFDSDLKGAVLVNCLPLPVQRGVDPATQAQMLARAYLTYLAHGVEVFFWYEFRDGGLQPEYNEHHFGMVTHDLQPKPAYVTLRQLVTALGPSPAFGPAPQPGADGVTCVRATGPDGITVSAYWSDRPGARVALKAAAFRAYDASWAPAPVEMDAEGPTLRLDAGPRFVIERAP